MDIRGYEMQAAETQDRLAEQRGLVRDLTNALENRNADVECLQEALRRIERITWREGHGEQSKLLLIDCRKIAYEALTQLKD